MFPMKEVMSEKWMNWSRNIVATPEYFHYPESISEIQQIVDSCRIRGKTLRVVGAGHSFSPVAKPDDEALSLDRMQGLLSIDRTASEATFWAGTYLYKAAPLLASVGMALENMGDIQEQTIAGAISTGTHGTGKAFGSLSSQVVAWTWIDGTGTVRHHRRDDDDLSKAISLSLGMLGVLIKVTIRTVPLYSLAVTNERRDFQDAMTEWDLNISKHRHLEWFYFPGVDTVQVKKMDQVSLVKKSFSSKSIDLFKNGMIETVGFKAISELVRLRPRFSRIMTKFAATNIPTGVSEGYYHEIFPSPRLVKFTECEYAIPLESFEACMQEMHEFLKAHPFYVHFPIECRVTAGEDAFLSPTQGKESAFLAFHMYKGMDNRPYFKWVQSIMKKYGGRPHFGKMNNLNAKEMESLYPNLDRFNEIRQENDPENVFYTRYFRNLIG